MQKVLINALIREKRISYLLPQVDEDHSWTRDGHIEVRPTGPKAGNAR